MAKSTSSRPDTADTIVEIPQDQQHGHLQAEFFPDNGSQKDNKEHIEEKDLEKKDQDVSQQDPFLIKLEPGDKEHPWSWSLTQKIYITTLGGILTLNSSFSSSAPTGLVREQMEEFGFGTEVGTLLISLFVAGYCVGPILWGPLSERYGRRYVFAACFLPYTLFQMAAALSPNTGAILTFRFLGGFFGACPLSNAGALMADLWTPDKRGIGMGLFALAPFAGPAIGPTISGFMSVQDIHWSWIYWVMTIFAGVCFIAIIFTLPETYVPYIEHKIAKQRRKKENEPRYHCVLEHRHLTMSQKLKEICVKPFVMIVLEPVLLAITIYMSFVYGCLYLLFEAFPIIFVQHHGLNMGQQGLCFLSLPVGGTIAILVYIFVFNPRYELVAKKHAPNRPPPEARLEMSLYGSPCLVISFFWIGFTSYDWISIWSPIAGTVPIGLAMILLFLSLMNYIVDMYLYAAASALAINTVVRSVFGAAFPLFASQMFDALGVRWACALLGFVALVLAPIPFLFYKFGPKLRKMSKFTPKI